MKNETAEFRTKLAECIGFLSAHIYDIESTLKFDYSVEALRSQLEFMKERMELMQTDIKATLQIP